MSRSWALDTIPRSTNAIVYHSSISNSVMVTPPPKYILSLVKPSSFVWYVIPPLKQGSYRQPVTFSYGFDDENIKKTRRSHVPTMLSGIILARWWRPVASSEALDLLHWAMRVVTYRHIAMAIKMAIFAGVFVDCCLYACCPGGRWGNTEWMPASSGFRSSPGHAALGDAVCIARAHCRGHRNGQQRRSFIRHHRFYHQP